MKKLLSLLSVLTISGSAIPTTIAASPYPNQEETNTIVKDSDINYQETNNLEGLNRNKRENNNQNIFGISEVVITANGKITTSGVVLNNKVYFGSYDHKVYEYDPATEQQKVVITANGKITTSGVVLNNKVYFGSYDHKVYEYDSATEQQKVVITANKKITTSGVVLNNKVYFGASFDRIYEYDPVTGQQKDIINIKHRQTYSSGITLNNKVYFDIDNKVYEYDPATEQQKVVITAPYDFNYFIIPGLVFNNKIYFCPKISSEIYEYDPTIGKQSVLIKTNNGLITSIGPVLNNKFYFWTSDKKFYEYDPVTGQQKNIEFIVVKDWIVSETFLNNKVYFGTRSNSNFYEYDPVTGQQKEVIIENDIISKIGIFLNNKFYFVAQNKVYECDPFELIESNNINIKDQIKKGLYLEYKKQNPNSKIKKIYNINLKELTLSDITIEQTQKNKSSNLEQDLNYVCKDSNSTFINNSSIEQTQNTIACSKQLTETNTFQKMNGFSKSGTTSNTDNWSANVNTKVAVKAGGEAGIPFVTKGTVEVTVEVGAGYTWGGSKTYTVVDTSTSSDTEIKTTTNTTTITVPSQPVKVPPFSKISISVICWENNIKLILSYYQKVNGVISADFIDKDDNKSTIYISIKDVMFNLLENNILPSKIKINDDNSISFSYDIKTEKQIIMQQTEIGKVIPLSFYDIVFYTLSDFYQNLKKLIWE